MDHFLLGKHAKIQRKQHKLLLGFIFCVGSTKHTIATQAHRLISNNNNNNKIKFLLYYIYSAEAIYFSSFFLPPQYLYEQSSNGKKKKCESNMKHISILFKINKFIGIFFFCFSNCVLKKKIKKYGLHLMRICAKLEQSK